LSADSTGQGNRVLEEKVALPVEFIRESMKPAVGGDGWEGGLARDRRNTPARGVG